MPMKRWSMVPSSLSLTKGHTKMDLNILYEICQPFSIVWPRSLAYKQHGTTMVVLPSRVVSRCAINGRWRGDNAPLVTEKCCHGLHMRPIVGP
ncbi:hypothetical protein ZWY2020_050346 [Hordeum vulgare]|nr:hypothetical protein ZWY2020_050346 [Hordeum vulgare]